MNGIKVFLSGLFFTWGLRSRNRRGFSRMVFLTPVKIFKYDPTIDTRLGFNLLRTTFRAFHRLELEIQKVHLAPCRWWLTTKLESPYPYNVAEHPGNCSCARLPANFQTLHGSTQEIFVSPRLLPFALLLFACLQTIRLF